MNKTPMINRNAIEIATERAQYRAAVTLAFENRVCPFCANLMLIDKDLDNEMRCPDCNLNVAKISEIVSAYIPIQHQASVKDNNIPKEEN